MKLSLNKICNRALGGVARYYATRITTADGSQLIDDYVCAFARMRRECGIARRQRMAELARTGMSSRDIDVAGLWLTPLNKSCMAEFCRSAAALARLYADVQR